MKDLEDLRNVYPFSLIFDDIEYKNCQNINYSDTQLFRQKLGIIPKKIIFNPPITIVYWNDKTKTIIKATNEKFVDEFGFAMALVKKLFPSRSKFLKMIKESYHQEIKK